MESSGNDLRLRKIKKTERGIILRQDPDTSRNENKELLHPYTGFVILTAFVIFLKIFYEYDTFLPTQLTIKESHLYEDRFIGERAELYLKQLTDLGPRVVGSYEAEVLAVDFFKREISFIQQQANPIHDIDVDIQKASGSYFLFLNHYGFRNNYANIQNIVVKLGSRNNNKAVLVNCHYDTVPESPGASDNGFNCVVMLEILRVLSSQKSRLKHNVIFLFNGAEENPLQGSHAFVTQHKWRNEVSVIINLDAAGAGGKEFLFQTTGEPWLIKSFSEAIVHPSAAVHGEELFQFGLIPSDTDFRIFRDFGHYKGFDFAHHKNGYVYHTKYDCMKFIQPGAYQHTGDNILALVKSLSNSPHLGGTSGQLSRFVYFDVFYFYFVSYTESFATFINIFTVILSWVAIARTMKVLTSINRASKHIFLCFFGQVLGFLVSVVVVLLTSKILDVCKSTLSWYARSWLIVPLYSFPIVLGWTVFLLLFQFRMKNEPPWNRAIKLMNGSVFMWTLVLLLATMLGIRSAFMIMLVLLFTSIGSLIATFSKKSFTAKKYVGFFCISSIFPILYITSQASKMFISLIPMMARSGPQSNPELFMGLFNVICVAPFLSQILSVLLMMRKLTVFLIFLAVIYSLSLIGVIYTDEGFPFSVDRDIPVLQRIHVFHNDKTLYNSNGEVIKSDSGFFVQCGDRNNLNYLLPIMPELKNGRRIYDDCANEIFCGFPAFTARFVKPAYHAYWIPSEPPYINRPTTLKVVSKTQVTSDTRRVKFKISGPDHMSIGISPRLNISPINWSFGEIESVFHGKESGRKTYFLYFSYGSESDFEFSVDLQGTKNISDVVMDVALVGHYMHEKDSWTKQFKEFLSKFPKWTNLSPWVTSYKSWEI